MAIAYRVKTHLVLAKGMDGKVHYYYHPDSGAGDSVIPWLSDEQAEHFLNEDLVEVIDIKTDADTDDQMAVDRVAKCVEELESCDVPTDCGAPAARDALRERGCRFSNETIAGAVKARKASLSGTVVVGEP